MDLEKDYQEAGVFARAIVAKRLAITAGVAAAVNFALTEHWLSVDVSNHVSSYVMIGLNGLGVVVGALWAKDGVTPADPALNPTSAAGEALAPVAGTGPRASRPTPDAAVIATSAAATLSAPPTS